MLKNWLSQRYINVRLPYQEDETTSSRIASFVGSTNDVEFLRSESGYSRWISFEVDSIDFLSDATRYIVEKSWEQAYFLYKLNEFSGELSEEDLSDLKIRSGDFTTKSTEAELITQYLSPSTKFEGEFMTATNILRYLQNIVGTAIRLNTKLVGSAMREAGFERLVSRKLYGYFVNKTGE